MSYTTERWHMRHKKTESEEYWNHFSNFIVKVFFGAIILALLCWLLGAMLPLLMPLAILLIIFTIFIYPIIKIRERRKKRDK